MSNEHRAENPVQNISNVVISAGGTYNVSLLRTRVAPSNLWQNKRTHYYTADHTHSLLFSTSHVTSYYAIVSFQPKCNNIYKNKINRNSYKLTDKLNI